MHGMLREAAAGEREAKGSMERRKKGERPCTSFSTQLTRSDSAFCLGSSHRFLLCVAWEDNGEGPVYAEAPLLNIMPCWALNSLASYQCDNVM